LQKLANVFGGRSAIPSRGANYATLEIRPGDAFGNAERATKFEWHRKVVRINSPTDRDEWDMTPQTGECVLQPDV